VRPPLRAAADAGTRRPGRSPRSVEGMPLLLGEGCGGQAARTPPSPSALRALRLSKTWVEQATTVPFRAARPTCGFLNGLRERPFGLAQGRELVARQPEGGGEGCPERSRTGPAFSCRRRIRLHHPPRHVAQAVRSARRHSAASAPPPSARRWHRSRPTFVVAARGDPPCRLASLVSEGRRAITPLNQTEIQGGGWGEPRPPQWCKRDAHRSHEPWCELVADRSSTRTGLAAVKAGLHGAEPEEDSEFLAASAGSTRVSGTSARGGRRRRWRGRARPRSGPSPSCRR